MTLDLYFEDTHLSHKRGLVLRKIRIMVIFL